MLNLPQNRENGFVRRDTKAITHGFTKKSQKTPPREIERAKRYRKEYQERMKGYDL
ncbi:MAG: type II toxin-antitoxin system RelE/ParE family toxin [Oscillospiraceae bacterium]|nr:type II toxin-antitoxin system RelE/ParE family toxin [Oscillospiraceae bacterium]